MIITKRICQKLLFVDYKSENIFLFLRKSYILNVRLLYERKGGKNYPYQEGFLIERKNRETHLGVLCTWFMFITKKGEYRI